MPDKDCSRTPRDGADALDMAEQDEVDDGTVLGTLLDANHPGLWSVDEVIRAFGGRVTAADSLMRLERDGLVHKLDKFVFPTRAAVRTRDIEI